MDSADTIRNALGSQGRLVEQQESLLMELCDAVPLLAHRFDQLGSRI